MIGMLKIVRYNRELVIAEFAISGVNCYLNYVAKPMSVTTATHTSISCLKIGFCLFIKVVYIFRNSEENNVSYKT